MEDDLQTTLATISAIQSLQDEQSLEQLSAAVEKLFEGPHAEQGIEPLFQLFERFPESEEYGLLWSIVQRLESLPGYEERLVESVQRQPGWFNVMMIQRLMNAGKREVNGASLLALLEEVMVNPRGSALVRKDAQVFVDWQRRQARQQS